MQLTPRKRYFIDPQVQGALLFRTFVYWCGAVLGIAAIWLCVNTIMTPEGGLLDYVAFDEFFIRYGSVLLASLILLPVIMLDVVRTSNRFAGPLYRLRRSIRALGAGEHVEPVHFRDGDYWKEVAEEFNQVIAQVDQLKKELAEARRTAAETTDLQPALQK